MELESKRCLVVFSGGADSTIALHWALQEFTEVHAVTFDYGQNHRRELESAMLIAQRAKVPQEIVRLGASILKGSSPLIDKTKAVGHYAGVSSLPGGLEDTFVPGRNILFLTLAANRAYCLGTSNLVTGLCQEDFGGYPDCRQKFVSEMERALSAGLFDNTMQVDIHTPLMFMTKAKSVDLAVSLPGCLDALAYSHTCLAKGTEVWALRGRTPIEQLGLGQYVWGWDDANSCWMPTQVQAVYDQGVKPVFRVILKDAVGRITTFDATADHRLMRRTGGYIRVDALRKGTRLKAAMMSPNGDGYYTIKPHNDWREQNIYAHRYVAECLGFSDEIIHHEDENHTNNDPSNLFGKTWSDHSKLHYPYESINSAESIIKRERTKQLRAEQVNHVVMGVRLIGDAPTYDITTGTRNFAIGAGIFVHNCYDGAYPPCPLNHASILRAKGFAEYGINDPLISRAIAQDKLPHDYPGSGLVEGTRYESGKLVTLDDGGKAWVPVAST